MSDISNIKLKSNLSDKEEKYALQRIIASNNINSNIYLELNGEQPQDKAGGLKLDIPNLDLIGLKEDLSDKLSLAMIRNEIDTDQQDDQKEKAYYSSNFDSQTRRLSQIPFKTDPLLKKSQTIGSIISQRQQDKYQNSQVDNSYSQQESNSHLSLSYNNFNIQPDPRSSTYFSQKIMSSPLSQQNQALKRSQIQICPHLDIKGDDINYSSSDNVSIKMSLRDKRHSRLKDLRLLTNPQSIGSPLDFTKVVHNYTNGNNIQYHDRIGGGGGLTSMSTHNERNNLPIQSIMRSRDHNIANNPLAARSSIFLTRVNFQNNKNEGISSTSHRLKSFYNLSNTPENESNDAIKMIFKGKVESPQSQRRMSILKSMTKLTKAKSSENEEGKTIQFLKPQSTLVQLDENEEEEGQTNLDYSHEKRETIQLNHLHLDSTVPLETIPLCSRNSCNSNIKMNSLKIIDQRDKRSLQIPKIENQKDRESIPLVIQADFDEKMSQIKQNKPKINKIFSPSLNQKVSLMSSHGKDMHPASHTQNNSEKNMEKEYLNDGSFLKHLDPKDQQQQKYSENFFSFKNGNSWYEQLGLKAEKVKERLRQYNKLINHMIQRRNKFISDQTRILEAIKKQKKLIQNQQSSEQDVKFEEEIQYDVELFKNQIEDLEDLFKEAQDLLTIFSIAIHQSDMPSESQPSTISKIFLIHVFLLNKSNAIKLHLTSLQGYNPEVYSQYLFIKYTILGYFIAIFNQILKKSLSSYIIYFKLYIIMLDMFDFDSESLQVYNGFCEGLKKIDSAIIEYKKYLKLDQDGEQFNIRTQNLMEIMRICEEYERMNKLRVNALNEYLQSDIRARIMEIQVQIDINLAIQGNIQESADKVNKLLYIKKDQIRRIDRFIEKCVNFYGNLNLKGIIEDDLKQIQSLSSDIIGELQKVKDIKRETKEESSDQYSQYFLKLKMKISNRIFLALKKAKCKLQSFLALNEFIRTDLILPLQDIRGMFKENKLLISTNMKLSDSISHAISQRNQDYSPKKYDQVHSLNVHIAYLPLGSRNSHFRLRLNGEVDDIDKSSQQEKGELEIHGGDMKEYIQERNEVLEMGEWCKEVLKEQRELKCQERECVERIARMFTWISNVSHVENALGLKLKRMKVHLDQISAEIENLESFQQKVKVSSRYDILGYLRNRFSSYLEGRVQPSLRKSEELINVCLDSFEEKNDILENVSNILRLQLSVLESHLEVREEIEDIPFENDISGVKQCIRLATETMNDLLLVQEFQSKLRGFSLAFQGDEESIQCVTEKIHVIQKEYDNLLHKAGKSTRYTVVQKFKLLSQSITHVLLFLDTICNIQAQKTSYIMAKHNLLTQISHVHQSLKPLRTYLLSILSSLDSTLFNDHAHKSARMLNHSLNQNDVSINKTLSMQDIQERMIHTSHTLIHQHAKKQIGHEKNNHNQHSYQSFLNQQHKDIYHEHTCHQIVSQNYIPEENIQNSEADHLSQMLVNQNYLNELSINPRIESHQQSKHLKIYQNRAPHSNIISAEKTSIALEKNSQKNVSFLSDNPASDTLNALLGLPSQNKYNINSKNTCIFRSQNQILSLEEFNSYPGYFSNSSGDEIVPFQPGNLEFNLNAYIPSTDSTRYIVINQQVEIPNYQEDDEFLNSCIQ